MSQELWKQAGRIWLAALEVDPSRRTAFIEEACGQNIELRREVESLLVARSAPGDFLEGGAVKDAAMMLIDDSFKPGAKLGHYRVLSVLGRGGMGEVYLAEDTRLKRRVALKVLPRELTEDMARVRRFQQEAQSASALNHPNIIVVFDIGEEELTHYIAMEFIEGQTLREHLAMGQMEPGEVAEVSIQIAEALASAHSAGIVHRDIKPENVMLRPDGYVKVLDFGLAKLGQRQLAGDTQGVTRVSTDPNIVLGTLNYMSPEQARGLDVDARSDIFSLGVLIYEMTAGHNPFKGDTSGDIIASILKTEPAPLDQCASGVPAELQWIVSKALRKDRDERYQTVKELLGDLKRLNHQLKSNSRDSSTGGADSVQGDKPTSARSNQQLTPSGDSMADAEPTRTVLSSRFSTRSVVVGLVAVLVIGLGIFAVSSYLRGRSSAPIESIAVLPFTNESHDPEGEYLSDGLTESIINNLTQLQQLRVIARSSVFRYKGGNEDPREIGRQLGVRAVLTGRVMQRGDELQISADLMDVRENNQLWGGRYERRVSDLLSLQREIAREISTNLQPKISGAEEKLVTKHYTDNSEAYQLYLKGRYYWNKRTADSITRAIDYFKQATEKDPGYALAYSGLADCYCSLGFSFDVGSLPPREAIPQANIATLKALQLDDRLAEAHTSLAFIKLNYDWDKSGSEREFKRALELNENYANAHHWYSHYLMSVGRTEESLDESKRALELEPLDLIMNTHLGWFYIFNHQYDQAIEQLKKTLDMDSNYGLAHWYLGLAYEQKKMYTDAIAEFKKGKDLLKENLVVETDMTHLLALSGQTAEAQSALKKFQDPAQRRYISSYQIALIYLGLGRNQQALEWLDNAYREKSDLLVYLNADPRLESLHSNPYFVDLVRRVGLTQ